jgi:hemerythrin
MPIIEWSEAYSLGIDEIDNHHQHLIKLLNETYQVFIGRVEKVEIEKVLEELVNYATYHFAAEEVLMAQYSYPQIESHKKQHEDFIRQITADQRDFVCGRKALSLELIVFMKDWIFEHILKSDLDYADIVINQATKKKQGAQLHLV